MSSNSPISRVKAVLAGATVLGLVVAGAPASAQEQVPVGTARTSLLGAELEVTGLPVDVPALQVLDAVTYASIDTDTGRNALGAPFSQVLLTPLRVGSTAIGQVEVNSQGTGTATSPEATSDAIAPLGAEVAPIEVSAEATSSSAVALVDTAVADLEALLGSLGLQLDASGIVSRVDASSAQALQGLAVGAVEIDLADLGLDADLLGTLPLGDLLELLEQLPLELPADVQALLDAIFDAVDGLEAALTAFDELTAAIPADVAAVEDAAEALDAASEGPTALLTAVETAIATGGTQGLFDLLDGADDDDLATLDSCTAVDLASLASLDLATLVTTVAGLPTDADTILAELEACVQGLVDDAAAVITQLTDDLTSAVDDLAAAVDVLGLGDLVTTVTELLGALDGLTDLLDVLDGLLDDIAGTPILSVGAFDVGVNAIAAATEADSSATLVCSALDVTILGETFNAPSCRDGLDQVAGALGAVTDAVTTITGLLNALPLDGLVETGDLGIEVFGELTESVTSQDGYVVSEAGMELLDLTVPSITLDPSAVTDALLGDALDGLDLPDVLGMLGLDDQGLPATDAAADTLAGALDAVQALDDTISGVTGVQTDLADLVDSVVDVDGLLEQLEAITALLDGLDLGELGTFAEAVTTPGLHLVVDPTSTAEFAVTAAPAPPTDPSPAPSPTPAPSPGPLPSTGGGLVLLGLVAAGGALALRRRG